MAEQNTERVIVADPDEGIKNTGRLFDALAKDPRYRTKVLSLIKEAAPETPIPELDLAAANERRIEERLKPDAEERKKTNERLDAMEKRLARKAFAEQNDLGEDELVDVETFAKENGITKAESAVKLYREHSALGTPRGTRKPPAGDEEFLQAVMNTNPRNVPKLKKLATERATRIITGRHAG